MCATVWCTERARTVGQDLGPIGGTETNVVEDEQGQTGAALRPERAHLGQQVQAAVQPQDHLLPIFSEGDVQEQLQPQNGQAAEASAASFGQCERQKVLQELGLWVNREHELLPGSLHSFPAPQRPVNPHCASPAGCLIPPTPSRTPPALFPGTSGKAEDNKTLLEL